MKELNSDELNNVSGGHVLYDFGYAVGRLIDILDYDHGMVVINGGYIVQ